MQSQQTGVSLIHIMLGIVVVTIISLLPTTSSIAHPTSTLAKVNPGKAPCRRVATLHPMSLSTTPTISAHSAHRSRLPQTPQTSSSSTLSPASYATSTGLLPFSKISCLTPSVVPRQHFARPTSINIGNTRITLCPHQS